MRKLFILSAVVLGTSVGLSLSSNISYASTFDTITVNAEDFEPSITSPVESKNGWQNKEACANGCGGTGHTAGFDPTETARYIYPH